MDSMSDTLNVRNVHFSVEHLSRSSAFMKLIACMLFSAQACTLYLVKYLIYTTLTSVQIHDVLLSCLEWVIHRVAS